jgi:hypothetical protein
VDDGDAAALAEAKAYADDGDAAALEEAKAYAAGIAIGVGQTWQNVKSSRALNTTYTNTTGRSIMVSATFQVAPSGYAYAYLMVQGANACVSSASNAQNSRLCTVIAIVPPGETYSAGIANSTLQELNRWAELR